MMGGKISLFLFIMAEISLAISLQEMKESKNKEEVNLKAPKKEVKIEELKQDIEKILLFIKEDSEEFRNLMEENIKELGKMMEKNIKELKNSIEGNKKELKNAIEETKKEININKDNNISKIKSDIENECIKLTSKIHDENSKVILEVKEEINDVKLKIIDKISSENKIIVKQFEVQSKIDNSKCENNTHKLVELKTLIDELKPFYPRNCAELLYKGDRRNGIRTVFPFDQVPDQGISVVCDQNTEGGGWTIFQTRDDLPFRENFYRNWKNYSKGFGDLSGEFWLGLENVHAMTNYTSMELRIDLEDDTGDKRFAKYDSFFIENSKEKFRLNIGTYCGDATDSLTPHNRKKFSTFDQDNDDWSGNCAERNKGAWWYYGCTASNLNGYQFVGKFSDNPPLMDHGIIWVFFRGSNISMKKTRMMFRPQGMLRI